MWMRLLFWKRKANRIYTACPEIRHLLNQDARNTVMNAARIFLTFPLWLLVLLIASARAAFEILDEKTRVFQPVADWAWRDTDAVREAHKILSPDEIKKRIN